MVYLSFDIEEFDVPAVEFGMPLSFEEQMEVSVKGTKNILMVLKQKKVKATFFCTATFAINAPNLVKQIVKDGHELASHGYYHSAFKPTHYQKSKDKLEEIASTIVKGFRMARMMPVDYALLKKSNYSYDSSLNPTYIPGRYNHFLKPKTPFKKNGISILPSSVTPLIRFPLFWLSFHNIPLNLFLFLSKLTLKKNKYLNIYFHPWEFVSLKDKKFGLPFYFVNKTGDQMVKELSQFITTFKKKNIPFGILSMLANKYN